MPSVRQKSENRFCKNYFLNFLLLYVAGCIFLRYVCSNKTHLSYSKASFMYRFFRNVLPHHLTFIKVALRIVTVVVGGVATPKQQHMLPHKVNCCPRLPFRWLQQQQWKHSARQQQQQQHRGQQLRRCHIVVHKKMWQHWRTADASRVLRRRTPFSKDSDVSMNKKRRASILFVVVVVAAAVAISVWTNISLKFGSQCHFLLVTLKHSWLLFSNLHHFKSVSWTLIAGK